MDPNSVVGTPRDIWVWLAPDWSDYQEGDKAPPGKTGWTRVKIRETLYNDGRIVRNVLDANGKPVAEGGAPATADVPARPLDSTPQYDPDQEKRWKEQQEGAKPPGGIPTRTINGQVFNWNPATRAYDIPTGETPATTTTPSGPPGGAAWKDDDEKEGKNGRRWGWNPQTRAYDRDLGSSPAAQEIARNEAAGKGPKTDAEIAAATPKPAITTTTINGQRYTTQTTPGANGGPPKIEHFGPDGKPVATLPVESKAPTPEKDGNGNWGYWDQQPGQPPKWVPLANGPQAQQTPVQVNGVYGVWKPGANGGPPTFEPIQNVPGGKALPPELRDWQPDPDKPGYGVIELTQTIQRLRAEGKLNEVTEKELTDFITSARANATAVSSQRQAEIANAQTAYTNAVNARNQQAVEQSGRSTLADSILARATSTGLEISKMAKPGSGSAITPYLAMGLGLQAAGHRELPMPQMPGMLQAAYNRATGFTPTGAAPNPATATGESMGDEWSDRPGRAMTPYSMTPERAASHMANPVFRPMTSVGTTPAQVSDPRDAPGYRGYQPAPVPAAPTMPVSDPASMAPPQIPTFLRGSYLDSDPRSASLRRIFGDDLAMQALGMG